MEKIKELIKLKTVKLGKINNDSVINLSVLEKFGLQNVQLRPHQLEGTNWLIARFRVKLGCILADEMGLGKTCQAISFLTYVYGSCNNDKPSLILLPLSVINHWKSELSRFNPNLNYLIYVGNKEERKNLRRVSMDTKSIKLIITTYEICLRDEDYLMSFNWEIVIVDEAHRLKNDQSVLYTGLFKFNVGHWLLLTGTPIQNNLRELYSLLSMCARDVFEPKLIQNFLEHYENVTTHDSDIKSVLENFILRRVKSEVLEDLPEKSEVILYHALTMLQSKYYRAILTKDIDAFQNDFNPTKKRSSLMNILMELRKCICHPYLFDGVEPEPFLLGEHLVEASGKLLLLDGLLKHLKSTGHKVLLFSQFTAHLDIVQDYMTLRKYSYERLDGSIRSKERNMAIENFNSNESTFVFLLSTRAGGLGLNLTSADTVIFLDSDFNPQNDLQAAARAHRIGQKKNVKVIKLVGRHTVEENILKKADDKLKLSNAVMSSSKDGKEEHMKLEDIIKFGLEKLFLEDQNPDVDFESILGKSKNGEWDHQGKLTEVTSKVDSLIVKSGDVEDPTGSIYSYHGDIPSAGDETVFQGILNEESSKKSQTSHCNFDSSRSTRGKNPTLPWMLLKEQKQKRMPLTAEQREAMKKKRQERMERLAKEREEKKKSREIERSKRRLKLWQDNSYSSHKLDSCEEEEEEEDERDNDNDDYDSSDSGSRLTGSHDSSGDDDNDDSSDDITSEDRLHFVVGDVTQPSDNAARMRRGQRRGPILIVHCVDNSGHWGRGGIFSSLRRRSSDISEKYEIAGRMGDLHLGDVHILPINGGRNEQVVFLVVQSRDRNKRLMDIDIDLLQRTFAKLSRYALSNNATLHFPRIGHNSSTLNWYATERSIRKHFTSKGIHAFIYYFPRGGLKRKLDEDDSGGAHSLSSACHSKVCKVEGKLPDFFKGISVSFIVGDNEAQTSNEVAYNLKYVEILTRYVMAYDGDVNEDLSSNSTHLIAIGAISRTEIPQDFGGKLVNVGWLLDSIKNQKIMEEDNYYLTFKSSSDN